MAKSSYHRWPAFQARRGGYGAVSSGNPSDGSARLMIAPLDDKARTPPTADQAAAYQHLMDNEVSVAAAVAHALVKYCSGETYDNEDDMEVVLEVSEPAGLRPLLGLSNVHALRVVRDGVACIGFEFGCVWDDVHGAGVMTHLGRDEELEMQLRARLRLRWRPAKAGGAKVDRDTGQTGSRQAR